MNDILEFEWDEAKSEQCLRDRGFSFAFVVPTFSDPFRRIEIDERRAYGEIRYRLYGRIGDRMFAVAYTVRGRTIRIISARKANARERRRHGDESPAQK